MASLPSLVTFGVYLIFLTLVGWYFYKKTKNIEDYLLGGRNMGKWVTALSAQASDMSGWLLMGLPGAIYLGGMPEVWIAVGLLVGTILNWILVAPRLRVYTQRTNSLTLPTFFEDRFKDPTGLLRIISAMVILFFFTIYASSGLVAAGKLFESMFGLDYTAAVLIGAGAIILYTFLGGFLAVCWTDLFQGALMFFAIVIVPVAAYFSLGSGTPILDAMDLKKISVNLIPSGDMAVLAILSAAAWGLGYFGQPHILTRFMSIKTAKDLPRSTAIASVWVILSLAGAVMVGFLAIAMYPQLEAGNHEKVFIYMIGQLFNPWLGGILLAAILSAIMSTIDSQLLVSSSALTEDFYKKIIKKEASEKEMIQIGRISVLIISVIALILALNRNNTVLGLVSYAWGGFGAAFGPLVLASLFSKKTTWKSALGGLVAGTLTLVLWKQMGMGTYLYEIVPGFAANALTLFVMNRFLSQQDQEIHGHFESVKLEVSDRKKD